MKCDWKLFDRQYGCSGSGRNQARGLLRATLLSVLVVSALAFLAYGSHDGAKVSPRPCVDLADLRNR